MGGGGERECSQVRFWVMSITQSFSALIFSASQFLLLCVRACVCLRPSIVKASSVWGWNSRGQINDVVLKTFLSSAKYLHRYFSMKHWAVLTGRFIQFTNWKQEKTRLNYFMCVWLSKHGAFIIHFQASLLVCATSWVDLLIASALTRGLTI